MKSNAADLARGLEHGEARDSWVFGNTWWVGARGVESVLITSPEGHVLIDGGLPESAPRIVASIKAAGFDIRDVRLILDSHVHHDHAGGIAELQRLSGARVVASPCSAQLLRDGAVAADDPQSGQLDPIAKVDVGGIVKDGELQRVGPLEKLAAREAGKADAFVDGAACRQYVATARRNLATRLATEQRQP